MWSANHQHLLISRDCKTGIYLRRRFACKFYLPGNFSTFISVRMTRHNNNQMTVGLKVSALNVELPITISCDSFQTFL